MKPSNPCYYCTEKRESGCEEWCKAYRSYTDRLSEEEYRMSKYRQYEQEKRALKAKGLTPQEYSQAIRELARRLKV